MDCGYFPPPPPGTPTPTTEKKTNVLGKNKKKKTGVSWMDVGCVRLPSRSLPKPAANLTETGKTFNREGLTLL